MLDFAEVTSGDFVMDLGSGDGRIVLTAASRYKARGLGIDIDEDLVAHSNEQAHRLGLQELARFESADALKTRIGEATVLTLYLLPELMNLLRDRVYSELKPGVRVVSHDFRFKDWAPDRSVTIDVAEKYGTSGAWQSTIYLWIVPAKLAGRWITTMREPGRQRTVLSFSQTFQHIEGVAISGSVRIPMKDARLEGDRIRFVLPAAAGFGAPRGFSGMVNGDTISGAIESAHGSVPWSATRAKRAAAGAARPAHPR